MHGDAWTLRRSAPRRNPAGPRLPPACYKPSPARQLTEIFNKLCRLMKAEWANIRSMNLGVRSGTAAVSDALYRQLQQLVMQLHALVIQHETAAAVLVQLAGMLSFQEGQQLQVLLDSTGHEELSDYLKLLLKDTWQAQPDWLPSYHSSKSASRDAGAGSPSSAKRGGGGAGSSNSSSSKEQQLNSSLKSTSSRLNSSLGRSTRANTMMTGSTEQGQESALGAFRRPGSGMSQEMIAEIARQRLLHVEEEGAAPAPAPVLVKEDRGLRFARYCHPNHTLVITAQQLQQQRRYDEDFQAAVAAGRQYSSSSGPSTHRSYMRSCGGRPLTAGDATAFAATFRRPGTSSKSPLQEMLVLDNTFSVGSGSWLSSDSPYASRPGSGSRIPAAAYSPPYHPYEVSCRDVEQIWAEGRAAAGLGALESTHIEQILEKGLDLIALSPGIDCRPRHAVEEEQAAAAPAAAAAAGGGSRLSVRSMQTTTSSIGRGGGGGGQSSTTRQSCFDSEGEAASMTGGSTAAASGAAAGGGLTRPPRRSIAWAEQGSGERPDALTASTRRPPSASVAVAGTSRPGTAAGLQGAAPLGECGSPVATGGTGTMPELRLTQVQRPSSSSGNVSGAVSPPISARQAANSNPHAA